MRTSARRYVVLRWVVYLACAALCAYWIAGFWFFARVSDNLNFTLWLWRGRIELWLFDSGTAPSITVHSWAAPEPAELHGLSARLWKGVYLDIARVPEHDIVDNLGGWPELSRPNNEFLCISVPVWLTLAVVAGGLLVARTVRRTRNGHCVCGYDLTGNASGRCPECGTIFSAGTGEQVVPKWTKAFIELYTADGYQGCWEGSPNPARGGWDVDDLPRLARRIREDMRYASAALQYCEDGDTLIIGVFDGIEPPDNPKRGRIIIPDVFEDHL